METIARLSQETLSFTIVCDERCAVVRSLGTILSWWDRAHIFTFVDRESRNSAAKKLIEELDRSPWSLFLIDENEDRWFGPEAIPIILKNLPLGKLAAVFYILPGTMWITNQAYYFVSRNRRLFTLHKAA